MQPTYRPVRHAQNALEDQPLARPTLELEVLTHPLLRTQPRYYLALLLHSTLAHQRLRHLHPVHRLEIAHLVTLRHQQHVLVLNINRQLVQHTRNNMQVLSQCVLLEVYRDLLGREKDVV